MMKAYHAQSSPMRIARKPKIQVRPVIEKTQREIRKYEVLFRFFSFACFLEALKNIINVTMSVVLLTTIDSATGATNTA